MSEKQETQIIETLDDKGNKVLFSLVEMFEFNKKEYALLNTVDEKGQVKENAEIVVMRLDQKGDDYSLELIDDNEFKAVSEYLESLAEEDE